VILVPIHSARGVALEDLLAAAKATGTVAVAVESVNRAIELAEERGHGGVAVISGSVYLVGEARTLLLGAEGQSDER
jgi:folylpolyglutamate synthase/dihydropteroate synthase